MKISTLISSAVLAVTLALAGTAQAATVNITGTVDAPGNNNNPTVNNFLTQLNAALNNNAVLLGPASITAPWPVRITFTLVAAESGYANSFTADPTGAQPPQTLSEGPNNNVRCSATTFASCGLAPSISGIFNGSLAGQLFFSSNQTFAGALNNITLGHTAFGVFTQGGAGNHSVFFLAFDDQNKNPDDNHDDIILRAEVSAVPVPAAGLMLLGALGGLAALRRRKAIAA